MGLISVGLSVKRFHNVYKYYFSQQPKCKRLQQNADQHGSVDGITLVILFIF